MRRAPAAAAALVLAAGGAFALSGLGGRLRHLAVPVLADPSPPAAPGPALVPGARVGCEVLEVARVAGRPTALLPAAGGLWVGTFEDGVAFVAAAPSGSAGEVQAARATPGSGSSAGAAPPLAGRRRFVNALAAYGGTVWAATQGGLVAVGGAASGRVLLPGEGVTALAEAGGRLWAGTAHGLFRVTSAGGAEPAGVAGPGGDPLRVTALAASPGDGPDRAGRLWIGTASGAWSLPVAALAADGLPRTAAWSPLVFGHPPADTNVVTALAPLPGGGALAGTDDGGLVVLGEDGEVAATRLADPRANEVNPGAAAAFAGGAAVGTQGGGLLLARAGGASLAVDRPAALASGEVSAVWTGDGDLLAATADGRVLRVSCGLVGAAP